MKIRMTFEGESITATLLDIGTARHFASMLPLTLMLKDFGDTEKISDLPRKLSTAGAPSGSEPSAGDLAFYAPWGNLAVFLKDFEYSSGLVVFGKFDAGIETMNRPGPLRVTIERVEE